MKCFPRIILSFFMLLPPLVYAQLIDNRDLPPEGLIQRAPFIPTDRAAVRTKDTGRFYVMDNADLITIQDFPTNKVSEVTMIGNVRIRFQDNYIRAEKVIITIKDSAAINVAAYGSVEFTLNKAKYLAESVNYQPKAERGVMYDVRSTLGGGAIAGSAMPWFFRAEKAAIQGKDRFILENVVLSTSDARFDHFSIHAKRVWFLQDKLTLAFGIQYKVGQAGFIWLPAYFQLEGGSAIHTSFGSEPNAGYYFINNLSISNKAGTFKVGFDIYERMGQYVTALYTAPPVGMLKEFTLQLDFANDVRVTKTNLPYNQWLDNAAQGRDVMNQFAWHYKLNTSIATNGFNLRLASEHLNDPFFLNKYSYRTRFANATSIDFFGLINQGYPDFLNSYQGDTTPLNDTLAHTIGLSLGTLSINASFNLGRRRNEAELNPFLNSAYFYDMRTMTLPDITLNPGSLTLANYEIKNNAQIQVADSRGRRYTVLPYELPALEARLAKERMPVVTRTPLTNEEGTVSWANTTNYEQVKITNKTEASYTWLSLNATATANFGFTGSQTFGSNIAGVNDLNNTNWRVVNDNYKHRESGQVNVNLTALNNLISVGNSLDAAYNGQWSSFNTDYTNNLRSTTFNLDYKLSAAIRSNFIWRDESISRIAMPFDMSFGYSQPIVRYNAFDDTTIKEGNLTWSTKLGWELLQWRRIPIIKLSGEVGIIERYRFPTDTQRALISSQGDPYYTDKTYSRLKVSGNFSLWWLAMGTSADIDLLSTKTNTSPMFSTNRYASDPVFNLAFTPDSTYHYIPSLTYNYYIHSNQSATLDARWTLSFKNLQVPKLYPFIYEISELGLVMNFHHDFLNLRNSYLMITFVLSLKFTKYLTFRFSSSMKNSQLYMYHGFGDGSQLTDGENLKNFWEDLGDSLKIWDMAALQRTSFKMAGITLELIHDMQTWDVRIMFRLGQVVDQTRQVTYWEPFVGVAFTMKGSSAAGIFPEFSRRFVPREYQ